MSLKARITEDMKAAMRARDSQRLSAIRLLLAAIKQREVDERRDLSDADVLATIDKMVKQRRDSIAQFRAGGREDLARSEQFELTLLQGYLPAALSDAELTQAVSDAIAASGAQGPQEMGKVMALLKARLAGRTDLSKVSAMVKARLAQ
jgi:uncharacterized protein YqeY